MKRVTIQEARKLFDMGINIYLLPSQVEYVPGVKVTVFTNNSKDRDFDYFVNNYKAVSAKRMRYYVDEMEVNNVKQAKSKTKKLQYDRLELHYTRSELMKIGANVASLWGAECYDYEIDNKKRKVTFSCIEHGEAFITEVSFDELNDYT